MFDTPIMTEDGNPMIFSVIVNGERVLGTLVCEAEPSTVMSWSPDMSTIYSEKPIAVRFRPTYGQIAREEN